MKRRQSASQKIKVRIGKMTDKFLYETLDAVSKMGFLKKEVPEFLKDNLNPKFELRPYQIFIEPKGKHLKEYDKWKQVFLKEISEKYKGKTLDFITPRATQKYRLVGLPFYNNTDENQFKQSLYEAIEN